MALGLIPKNHFFCVPILVAGIAGFGRPKCFFCPRLKLLGLSLHGGICVVSSTCGSPSPERTVFGGYPLVMLLCLNGLGGGLYY